MFDCGLTSWIRFWDSEDAAGPIFFLYRFLLELNVFAVCMS